MLRPLKIMSAGFLGLSLFGLVLTTSTAARSQPIDIYEQVWMSTADAQIRDSQNFCPPDHICEELCVFHEGDLTPQGAFRCYPI